MPVNLGEGYVPIYLTGMTAFRAGLSRAHAQLSMTVQRMDAVARQAKFGLFLAAGATAGALRIAGGFEQGMARVKALTGATGESFEALRLQAMTLGRTTVFTARQSADAMSYFALAGFDAQKIMQAMPATLDLAAAGQIDVAEAADIAAKIMAGMGIQATELSHVMDVLTKAFTTSNTDLRMLGDAFKYVGPVGRSAGKSVEELAATIMAMSNAGIQGQQAGTTLRNILIRLQAQPAEVKKALEALGVEIQDDSGRMKHLAQIIDEVAVGMQRLTPVEQQATASMLAGTRAVSGFSVLLEEGGDAIRGFEERLQGAAGTAKEIAEVQLDVLNGSLKLLWSAVEGLAIEIGNRLIPLVRSLTDRFAALASGTAESSDQLDKHLALAGNFVRVLATLVGMTAALRGLVVVVGLAATPFAPWAVAITALAGALAYLGVTLAEATVRGERFGDQLSRNFRSLLGLSASLTDQISALSRAMEAASDEYVTARGKQAPTTPEQIENAIKAAQRATTEAIRTANEAARNAEMAVGHRRIMWEQLRDAANARVEALRRDQDALFQMLQNAEKQKQLAASMRARAETAKPDIRGPGYQGPALPPIDTGERRLPAGPEYLRLTESEYEAALRRYDRSHIGKNEPYTTIRIISPEGKAGMLYFREQALKEKEKAGSRMEFSGLTEFWTRTQQRIDDAAAKRDEKRNELLQKIQEHVKKINTGLD